MSAAPTAQQAAHEAASEARAVFDRTHASPRPQKPKLAIVFVSLSYDDARAAPGAIRELIGDVPIVGGSAGGAVIGPETIARKGVSVVLLGGDDIEVACEVAGLGSPELLHVVPAASRIASAADAAARRGLPHYACFAFAPGIFVDGEALVAAIRKGAGARAQLAGALTGDELTMDRPRIFVRGEGESYALDADHVVLAGIFTRRPIGIAARHGWRAVGPARTVTRAEGAVVYALDERPILDVWLEDARAAGASIPKDPKDLVLYLANHYELGIDTRGNGKELVVRAPWEIGADRSVRLSGSIGEGRRVRVVHASRKELLRASTDATADAILRVGTSSGALVLACSGRLAALGEDFPAEPAAIRRRIAAPIGGACVFGEIARNERDVDAFFNTTAVVVAFPT